MKLETLEAKMRRAAKAELNRMQATVLFGLSLGISVVGRIAGLGGVWYYVGAALIGIGFASGLWASIQQIKERRHNYRMRLLELGEAKYHAVRFDRDEEAAAFVAALGRQLHAQNEDLASWEEDVEISAIRAEGHVVLYLSDGAMTAFSTAFTAPPTTDLVAGVDLPADRVPLLVGTPVEPIGLEDVMRRLDGKSDPVSHRTFRLTFGPQYSDGEKR